MCSAKRVAARQRRPRPKVGTNHTSGRRIVPGGSQERLRSLRPAEISVPTDRIFHRVHPHRGEHRKTRGDAFPRAASVRPRLSVGFAPRARRAPPQACSKRTMRLNNAAGVHDGNLVGVARR